MDTRDMIMDAAQPTVQAHGYNGLSFRELGKEVGIKSASVHYHFPTKGDLGAALARRYTERARISLDDILTDTRSRATRLQKYVALFRHALESKNRMCLCGIMSAEYDDLPDIVKVEIAAFAEANISWLVKVLAAAKAPRGLEATEQWAIAIYAAIGGAQLASRGRGDIAMFDSIIASYRASGLLPR